MNKRVEQVRQEILDQCYGHLGQSRSAAQIVKTARLSGVVSDLTESEVEQQAAALVSMKHLELDPIDFAQGTKRWVISGDGIKFLEAKGLV